MRKLIILTPVLSVVAMMFLASCASEPKTTSTTQEVTRPAASMSAPTTYRPTGGY